MVRKRVRSGTHIVSSALGLLQPFDGRAEELKPLRDLGGFEACLILRVVVRTGIWYIVIVIVLEDVPVLCYSIVGQVSALGCSCVIGGC